MNLETLETEGIAPWSPKEGVSAHCKVDESTGELLFFNYGFDNSGQWFFNYGEVDRNSSLTNYQHIPLTQRMAGTPHDMAFSKKYSILAHFGKTRSHFAVIPRHGTAEQVRWFEAGPTCIALSQCIRRGR